MIWPFDDSISLRSALSRSSNSPRYLVPAINEPRSRATTFLSFRDSGTSPWAIRWARPSTIAVLPTPASPISTGLFLVRRERTLMTRRISCSRPITGSSFPSRASAVRSRLYFSSAWNFDSGVASVTRDEPRTWVSAWRIFSRVTPARCRIRAASLFASSTIAISTCSVDRYSSLSRSISFQAASSSRRSRGLR